MAWISLTILQSVTLLSFWFYLKLEDHLTRLVLGKHSGRPIYCCYNSVVANSVNFWWEFLGNFGLQNEIMLLGQRLWLVPCFLSNKTKVYSFSLFGFFFLYVCQDEFMNEQEMSEKKHGLESNENSPEVSGLTHVN